MIDSVGDDFVIIEWWGDIVNLPISIYKKN